VRRRCHPARDEIRHSTLAQIGFVFSIKFGYQNGIHYICKKDEIMTVVSIRDFRANQGKYLGMAAGGESVILTSRVGSFKIVPITEDDSLVSKKEFFARIDEARKSIAEGKGTFVSGKEELDSLLANL
jgi:antitoxin (DNA-binding transcriptional repressor) of toxin-antitoxin stability system